MEDISSVFEDLRALAAPDEIESLAEKGQSLQGWLKSNAHIHLPPNFTAFESINQAVEFAAAQDVYVLGASNYYDYSIYADFALAARRSSVFPLFGLEIIVLMDDLLQAGILVNDPGNPGRMYLCGKGITRFAPMTSGARDLINLIRWNDRSRMRMMIEKLRAIFASRGWEVSLDEPQIIAGIAAKHGVAEGVVCLQERHLAEAFQEQFFKLFPPPERSAALSSILGIPSTTDPADQAKIQNEIRSHLMKVGKPAFVKETFLNFEQSYRLILELGGIPCYPTLADGTKPICTYEDPVEKLIDELQRSNIYCAEFIPIRNEPDVLEHYVHAIRRAGFVVTAGTEHNTPQLIPLEPRCVGGAAVPLEVRRIFWEGVCVVAAHQFLSLHGLCGYVDGDGNLNPRFDDPERRIDYFRALGAAVIARYHGSLSLNEGEVNRDGFTHTLA